MISIFFNININVPLPLTGATLIAGIPPDLGAVLDVMEAYKAKWLFEAKAPDTGRFEPALDLFDRLHTDSRFQLVTSVGGAFYFTPPVCTGDHDKDDDVDGSDLAVQASSSTGVSLAAFAASFGMIDCSSS